MRTVLVLAFVVTLALAGTVPTFNNQYSSIKTEQVDAATAARQYKVLELLENVHLENPAAQYYQYKNYDLSAHHNQYEKPEVVENFLTMYHKDFIPKYSPFTIFNEKMRHQAKALYDVFYYAKDFDTFYYSASWARANVNPYMFTYVFYIAVIQRADTASLILPPFYEVVPEYYVNHDVFTKIYYGKMRGEVFEEFPEYGIYKEGNYHLYYQNYSDYHTYGDEYKLAYLTEDIGFNSFYYYFHAIMPFWQDGDEIAHGIFKERRGEIYYHFYQQLLARYYLERLSNNMGEIPTFSWYQPFKQGYRPVMSSSFTPFVQRSDNYVMQNSYNLNDLRFVRNYEDMFLTFVEEGQFSAFNQQVDFSNEKFINFVGNFWNANPDLFEKLSPHRNYYSSYEIAARSILSGAPPSYNYDFMPSALDFYQTSLRDPAFYQMYNKIYYFISQYKQYLPSYTQEQLHYVGVKVNKVEVSKLQTYFDFHAFNVSNMVYYTNQEIISGTEQEYAVVQPRLNHQPFTVKVSVKSEVEEQATFKVFIGPKYDGYGNEINFEDNYMNFVELDYFTHKLTKGENVIERNSNEFFFYKEDSVPTSVIYKFLAQNKVPYDMVYNYDNLPNRLMLPRGTNGGFPLQVFVVVYKSQSTTQQKVNEHVFFLDEKPLGYPLDRPVTQYFMQPNMYVQDVVVYQQGSEYPNVYNMMYHSNESTKH
ncbi:unnamed protein product [Diatraea saccharalis]|uniref:Uncharacterized protein n=1 Tax=Diatraea saccharalis TaxID=40085 RepID=A0A9N9WEJ2_9NEOP|nr:unnamed protein product [Diatraea saccharalis]